MSSDNGNLTPKQQYKLALGIIRNAQKDDHVYHDIYEECENEGVSESIAKKAWKTHHTNTIKTFNQLTNEYVKLGAYYHAFDRIGLSHDSLKVRWQAQILMWGAYSLLTGKYPQQTVTLLKEMQQWG